MSVALPGPHLRSTIPPPIVPILALCFALCVGSPLTAVVISEIHYNPADGVDGLEFIELVNETTTPEDISGYQFVSGISYEIPEGTVLSKGEALVICADADLVRTTYGISNAIGNFIGRLDGSGERLTFVTQAGIELQSIRYRDEGKWPVEADGTGHSLVLRRDTLDTSEPESWTWSPELGGSPGAANFSDDGPRFQETLLIDVGETWRYRRGTMAFSAPDDAWRDLGFDDSAWETGETGIGYGDGDDATELADMRNSYTTLAARKVFTLTADDLDGDGDFFLLMTYDDGFCAFTNGTEAASANCNASLEFDSTATGSHEATGEEAFPISRGALVEGDNVLAVMAINFSLGSSDLSMAPRLVRRRLIKSEAEGRYQVVFNELSRSATAAESFLELFNGETSSVDLSGYAITEDPALADPYTFPAGSIVPARGFLAVDGPTLGTDLSLPEVRVFLIAPSGHTLAAAAFDATAPPELEGTAWSELRYPDGGEIEWISATPTFEAANEVDVPTDLVINEIFYHAPEERGVEFLELFNRGAETILLDGFSFDKGITFTFEAGAGIGPGEHLVLTNEEGDFRAAYPGVEPFGVYTGRLADAGENVRIVDPWDNPVDNVRYHDGGRWSIWADGRGSSLELIDPYQDNSVASAWEASDEDDKSEWQELSYSVSSYVTSGQSELHLFLVERGRCLIDDISIRRGAGANQIPNGGFESSTSGWRIEGTHVRSRRVTWDRHAGNACLYLEASGKGDSQVNRIEADTSPRLTRGAYDVSLWARWLRGSNLLIGHGEFTGGAFGGRPGPSTNLSGNTLGGKFRLPVPTNLGTPGAENSVRAQLRDDSGSDNLGPVISEVDHQPSSPSPNERIEFRLRATDPDGVSSVRVFYRTGHANGDFSSTPLEDGGIDGDRRAGDGVHVGRIDGYGANTKVVFYFEATDSLGASRRYPRTAPDQILLLQVQGPISQNIDVARWILDDARNAELSSRQLHSNDLLDGAFVFNNDESFYNVGVRYRGSPWGRPSRANFRVKFQKDRRFHRGRTAMNFTSRGSSASEGIAYALIGRNGVPGSPAPTADYFWVRAYYNGSSRGTYGMFQPVDRDYMQKWYPGGADGPVLKASGRLLFNDSGSRVGWDGASYVYMTSNTENYRSYYYHSVNQTRDDWDPFISLARVMDRRVTSNTNFDAQIDSILDVEAWFRVIAPRVLMGGWDAFSIGNGHNGYLSFNSDTGKWGILPFDMDNSFGQGGFPFFPTSDADVVRMMGRPGPRRTYYRVLTEYTNGYWSTAANEYLEAVARDIGLGTGGHRSFIASRRANAISTVGTADTIAFSITSNSGNPLTIDEETVTLSGNAPVTAASILVTRNDREAEEFGPSWTSPTRWRAELELYEEVTSVQLIGFDVEGQIVGNDTIEVTSTVMTDEPRVDTWFPENGDAGGGYDVTFRGRNLTFGVRVFFGRAEAMTVTLESPQTLTVTAPRAVPPVPEDGLVDVRFVFPDGAELVLDRAFEYTGTLADVFTRGDANRDFDLDISDAMATLLHLFRSGDIRCPDAADFDDSGVLTVSDAIGSLGYLYQHGPAPAAPFPDPGVDPTDDDLICE